MQQMKTYLPVCVWNDPRDKLRWCARQHGDAVAGHGFGKGSPALGKLCASEPREELVLAQEVGMGVVQWLAGDQAASVACCTVAGPLGKST